MPFALNTIYAHVHASTRCVYNANIVDVYMHACMRAERCVRVCVCVCVCVCVRVSCATHVTNHRI